MHTKIKLNFDAVKYFIWLAKALFNFTLYFNSLLIYGFCGEFRWVNFNVFDFNYDKHCSKMVH